MAQGTMGPELAPVGNELVIPEAASELERAAAALEGMTEQVQGLMADLKKEREPAISLEAEQGATAATALLEVSTRSASLAKALSAAKQPDMAKLAKEAGALMALLQPIAKSEAEVDLTVVEPVVAPTSASTVVEGPDFKVVAEQALAAATKLATAKAITDDVRADVAAVAKSLSGLAEHLAVEKAELELALPQAFTAEVPQDIEVLKAMEGICRDVAGRISAAHKLVDGVEVSDVVKKEIGLLQATVEKASASWPVKTTKASQHLVTTLKDVAGRTLDLTQRATEASNDALVLELQSVSKLVEALVEKYQGADAASSFEMSDLGHILSADRLLHSFEAQMAKLEAQAKPPVVAPAPAVAADGEISQLTEKITALGDQLKTMQAAVAKARDNVVAPVANNQDPDLRTPTFADNGDLLYPRDYNDPDYKEKLAKRGIE